MNIIKTSDGFKDTESKYELRFNDPWSSLGPIEFRINSTGAGGIVTSRAIGGYGSLTRRTINSGDQIMEVGAGLGEAVPWLVKRYGQIIPPIVVADPFDYQIAFEIMDWALHEAGIHDKSKRKALREMKERCKVMRSPKVRHFKMNLRDMVVQNPNLHHSADLLLDNHGANFYGDSKTQDFFKTLSKPTTRMIILPES
jgi:hypothetical protein